jgi:uncharacterized protein YdhG (YjbR/CyaY superfamily)
MMGRTPVRDTGPVGNAGAGTAASRPEHPNCGPANLNSTSTRPFTELVRAMDDNEGMDDAVRNYIDAIAPEHRPLFDRLHRLVLETHPEAKVVLSYQIPTYKVGRRRLFVGVWRHGVSIYGWEPGRDAGFIARRPELKTSKGTIQLRSNDAAAIPDDEFRDLVRAVLDG